MKLKSIFALTGLAWAATLPPALSTSCSANGEYELIIYDHDGITLQPPTKIFKNQDLYVHYTLVGDAKIIDVPNTLIEVNDISVEFRAGSGPARDGWTYNDEYIMISKALLTDRWREKNNNIEFWILAKS